MVCSETLAEDPVKATERLYAKLCMAVYLSILHRLNLTRDDGSKRGFYAGLLALKYWSPGSTS